MIRDIIIMALVVGSAAVAVDPPTVTLFPGANNVYGKAQLGKDNGAVKYLGRFNLTDDCASACSIYQNSTAALGQVCHSFTHHLPNFPTDWKGLCFGITDHRWTPVPDASQPPIITSGKVLRGPQEEQPCSSSSSTPATTVQGCTWQVDPWCLDGASIYKTATLTTADALKACASDDACRGVAFAQTSPGKQGPTSKTPIAHTFHNTTKGGFGNCWAHRRHFGLDDDPFRTWFHYQPSANWMNDPNGPMYHEGVYHLFHQYNPLSNQGFANSHWGHAVSTDMVRWREIAVALAPDVGNECGGEWSGSATPAAVVGAHDNISAHTGPVLSFSVQCNSFFGQAEPSDPTDALLTNWTKPKYNPTAHKPPYVPGGFRDPSEAFLGSDGLWRQVAACTGGACLFTSKDFTKWDAAGYAFYGYGPAPGPPPMMSPVPPPEPPKLLVESSELDAAAAAAAAAPPPTPPPPSAEASARDHLPNGPPTWECPDLFQLPNSHVWVFKASGALTPATAKKGVDFWSIGTFNETSGKFVVGTSRTTPKAQPIPNDLQRVDYGLFYASKTFYDPMDDERVIIGWIEEEANVPVLEWASVQSVPRSVKLDPRGGLYFPPVKALESLRVLPPMLLGAKTLSKGSVVKLPADAGGEHLDLVLTLPSASSLPPGACVGVEVLGGAANATITAVNATSAHVSLGGHMGPFDLAASGTGGGGGPLELRVLVDSSIVEAFADGGRATVTHRTYPMAPSPQRGVISLLNCGDLDVEIESFEAFQMAKATPPSVEELRANAQANVRANNKREGAVL